MAERWSARGYFSTLQPASKENIEVLDFSGNRTSVIHNYISNQGPIEVLLRPLNVAILYNPDDFSANGHTAPSIWPHNPICSLTSSVVTVHSPPSFQVRSEGRKEG